MNRMFDECIFFCMSYLVWFVLLSLLILYMHAECLGMGMMPLIDSI